MLTDIQQLPPNFSSKILQLQSLLDDQTTLSLITDLNELYIKGIDYYIKYDIRRANHFKKKMNKLLTDPSTLNLIENQDSNIKMEKDREREIQYNKKRFRIREEVDRFNDCSRYYVDKMMERVQKGMVKKERLIQGELNKQKEELQNRILLKKVKSQQNLLKKVKSQDKIDRYKTNLIKEIR